MKEGDRQVDRQTEAHRYTYTEREIDGGRREGGRQTGRQRD